MALYIILLLTVIIIALAVLQKSMRPFYRILDWLNGYTPGQSRGPVEVTTNVSEFTRLKKTVSEMADRSEDAFEKQKQFIGNAFHELQTPLAVLGGRIDWMLDNEPLSESATGELIQMRRSLGHITRMNKTLLLLTKIDNGQFPEMNDVNLNKLIEEQMNMLTEVFAGKGMDCRISTPDAPVVARMNEALAGILVTNLVKNAFVHSPEGGGGEDKYHPDRRTVGRREHRDNPAGQRQDIRKIPPRIQERGFDRPWISHRQDHRGQVRNAPEIFIQQWPPSFPAGIQWLPERRDADSQINLHGGPSFQIQFRITFNFATYS